MDFETHTALMNLPKKYDDAICRKDYDAYAELFTEDAVWDAAHLFVAKGKKEIYDRFKASFDIIDWVVRMPQSTLILECDGKKARLRTYFLEVLKLTNVPADNAIKLSNNEEIGTDPIMGVYTYTDDCVKESDGHWRISFHKIHIAIVGKLDLKMLEVGFPVPGTSSY